jgi:FkbM family methyltransferase
MDHPFSFRPGTCDQEVFRAVAIFNEYHIPDSFEPEDIILDIGTHIGSFSYAALLRGSRNVHGFEAFRDNFECAMRNLAPYAGQVTLHNRAVWRSDRDGETLHFTALEEANNAAGHVLGAGGTAVKAIGLDEIISRVTWDGRKRVRLIKMDCEGSEFPILLTAKKLHLVDAIVGEYHNFTEEHGAEHPFHKIADKARVPGYDRYTIDELSETLRSQGFEVSTEKHPQIPTLAGWFFAELKVRPSVPSRWHVLRKRAARLLSTDR